MARLLRKNETGESEVLELNLGLNSIGRDAENHFIINHPTVSAHHCDIVLTAEAVLLRDNGSTNGTFLNNEPVNQAVLQSGQTLRLGDIELFVEATEVTIAIPRIERPIPAPPVVLADGGMLCPRHPAGKITHRCTHCHAVLCDTCVTRIRRSGGKTLKLCTLCSHPVELIEGEKPKKKSVLAMLAKTIRLPFTRGKQSE